ncbi:MAG: hypothetical protein ABI353_15490 [Isosphaeraceae bacterium]
MDKPARLPLPDISSPYIFLALSALLVGYILYTMIRRRKGERPGSKSQEPEL